MWIDSRSVFASWRFGRPVLGGEAMFAVEALLTIAALPWSLAHPLRTLGVVVNILPVHLDPFDDESSSHINHEVECASSLLCKVFLPRISISCPHIFHLLSLLLDYLLSANLHIGKGRIDTIVEYSAVVHPPLLAYIVVGHVPINTIHASHFVDVILNDSMCLEHNTLALFLAITQNRVLISGRTNQPVVKNHYLLAIHPIGVLQNIRLHLASCLPNCLLGPPDPASANQLLGGVAEFVKWSINGGAGFLLRKVDSTDEKNSIRCVQQLHQLLGCVVVVGVQHTALRVGQQVGILSEQPLDDLCCRAIIELLPAINVEGVYVSCQRAAQCKDFYPVLDRLGRHVLNKSDCLAFVLYHGLIGA
mmetsp:Transcript_28371/g.67600  ORF Transcript_28371/g.67600 Transcript_28371/m.67600 type:complete len:362 (-) Transcript_28371:2363-3448(-)